MILYARTQPGLQKRFNEDCTLINDNVVENGNYCKLCDGRNYLAAVADGVGGHSGARIASNYVLNALGEDLRDKIQEFKSQDRDVNCDLLKEIIVKINKELIEYSAQLGNMKNMASTLSGIYSVENTQYLFHTGNTRICAYKNGKVVKLTTDHTTVNQLIESGELSKEDAMFLQMKNEINCCMGGGDEKLLSRIDVHSVSDIFSEYNMIFITSDGVHDFLEDIYLENTISAIIEKFGIGGLVSDFTVKASEYTNEKALECENIFDLIINCLDSIACTLIDEAHFRGSNDDTSVVIILK